MCNRALNWAWNIKVDNLPAKLVLVSLADSADENLKCFPYAETIARRCGISRASTYRALDRLIKTGLVARNRRQWPDGGARSSEYVLLIPVSDVETGESQKTGGSSQNQGGESHTQRLNEPLLEPLLEPRKKVPAQSANEWRIDMGQDQVPVDEPPKARLFREGKTILVALGVSEKRSGSVIGMWLKHNPDAVGVLAALEYAYQNNVIEPIAYVTKLLNTGGKTNGKRYDDLPSWERGKILAERARQAELEAGIGRQDGPVGRH